MVQSMFLSLYFIDVQALAPGAVAIVSGDVGEPAGFYFERVGATFQFGDRRSVVEVVQSQVRSQGRLVQFFAGVVKREF